MTTTTGLLFDVAGVRLLGLPVAAAVMKRIGSAVTHFNLIAPRRLNMPSHQLSHETPTAAYAAFSSLPGLHSAVLDFAIIDVTFCLFELKPINLCGLILLVMTVWSKERTLTQLL